MDHTSSPSGFGVHKLRLKPDASREQRLERSEQMLARVLNLRTTVAFVGSGCSVPLGYPSWPEFARIVVGRTISRVAGHSSQTNELNERLERFERQLSSGNAIPSDLLLFMLGVCQRAFEEYDPKNGKSEFLSIVAKLFATRDVTEDLNPYHALMDLPIYRFVTSNYDLELERALHRERSVPRSHLLLDDPPEPCSSESLRSFTQQPKHFDQLALFVLSRVAAADNMVFHCHGSYLEQDSMVISESDYQAWYYCERDDAGVGFRQNLHLLFGSNPILFVGFGLADDDLLRPLRMFAAEDLKRRSTRPLFALMPQKESATAEEQKLNDDYFDQLYDRYGVHVIPYRLEDRKGVASEYTLFHELKRWTDERLKARDAWLEKPTIRQVDVNSSPPEPYHHYPFKRHTSADFKGPRVQELLDKMCAEMNGGTRVIGLIGPGGTGKSWLAHQLMELAKQRVPNLNGNFFWSSYYSNDSLTGLDRALAYLDPKGRHKGDRIERFIECLHDGRHLLVFDGIERFLCETDNPMVGKGFTPLAEKLLEAMCSERSHSTVVITSRLWPKAFDLVDDKLGRVRQYRIQRFRSEEIKGVEPFSWQLDQEKNWNPRAKSIFLRHKADLKIKFGEFNKAKDCIEMSRGLAEEGNFPELAAAARTFIGSLVSQSRRTWRGVAGI